MTKPATSRSRVAFFLLIAVALCIPATLHSSPQSATVAELQISGDVTTPLTLPWPISRK